MKRKREGRGKQEKEEKEEGKREKGGKGGSRGREEESRGIERGSKIGAKHPQSHVELVQGNLKFRD